MATVRTLPVPGAGDVDGSEVPYVELGDRSRGPSVTLIAGVHGCEYSSMRGLRRFIDEVDESTLAGHVTAVPIVNLSAFHDRTPFVTPHDGRNLNRCFPGDPDGSFSERLAAAVFDRLVRPADALVDMHCGDMVEALAPFTLYDAGPAEGQARQLAAAYGLGWTIRSEGGGAPIAGTSSAACAEIGIPAITAEAGGCGLVDEASVQSHLAGVRRVLAHLGVLDPHAAPPAGPPAVELERWVWVRADHDGWWSPSVGVGERLETGAVVGTVTPLVGAAPFDERVVAPEPVVPIFVTTSPAVRAGGLLAGLGVLPGR